MHCHGENAQQSDKNLTHESMRLMFFDESLDFIMKYCFRNLQPKIYHKILTRRLEDRNKNPMSLSCICNILDVSGFYFLMLTIQLFFLWPKIMFD